MTDPVWRGTIRCRCATPAAADRLLRTLQPELQREVPRARARVELGTAGELRIEITARDTGALRAALQTYLGWLALTDATERAAVAAEGSSPEP